MLKTLGRKFSCKMIVPRIKKVLQLDWDCKIIDINKGFLVARFYSRDDYISVFKGSSWVVFGHCLSISK